MLFLEMNLFLTSLVFVFVSKIFPLITVFFIKITCFILIENTRSHCIWVWFSEWSIELEIWRSLFQFLVSFEMLFSKINSHLKYIIRDKELFVESLILDSYAWQVDLVSSEQISFWIILRMLTLQLFVHHCKDLFFVRVLDFFIYYWIDLNVLR